MQTPAAVAGPAQRTVTAGPGGSVPPPLAASSAASVQAAQLQAAQFQATQFQAAQFQPASSASASQAESQPVSSASGKASATGATRSVGGARRLDTDGEGKDLKEGQNTGPAVDASAMMRDPSGQRGAGSAAGNAGGRGDARGGPTPGETFAALDADSGAVQPTWIHAGAQQAEAGYEDPTLGWVSVRADMSGGGVHAELVAGSADAAQALSGHMEGLSAYLADHHTPVETLTLSSPQSGWSGMGGQAGSGQGMQQDSGEQGAGQQAAQQAGQGVDSGFRTSPVSSPVSSPVQLASGAAATAELAAWPGGLDAGAQAGTSGGAYISVMA